ncbi:MAG: YkgJ family cysteine cluster protein [Syntrophobacteraceae bacterium]
MKRSRWKRSVMVRNIEQLNDAQDVIEAARLALRAFDLSRIETNLARIEELSGKREKENWEFRAFLKSECEPEILDALVHELNRMVSEAVDCSACMNCCRETIPSFDQEDIERFAEGLGSSPEEFSKEYLIISDEGDLTFRSVPCPFLGDKGCKNQAARPKDLRVVSTSA